MMILLFKISFWGISLRTFVAGLSYPWERRKRSCILACFILGALLFTWDGDVGLSGLPVTEEVGLCLQRPFSVKMRVSQKKKKKQKCVFRSDVRVGRKILEMSHSSVQIVRGGQGL